MKKINTKLKSRRGITITEVLVTLAIVSILLPATIGSMFSVMNSYMGIKNMADVNILSANLENVITNQLAFGYNTTISSDKKNVQFEKYGSESVKFDTHNTGDEGISILYMNDKPYFDEAYYEGISTTANFENIGNAITVSLIFSGRVNYSTSFTVKPLSIKID